MYLSLIKKRIELKSLEERISYARRLAVNRKKYGDFSNEQDVHRMICDMAGGCKREMQNLLYIKIGKDARMFYIQSDHPLDEEVVCLCGYEIISVKNEGTILDSIQNGDQVMLRAKLAPVEKREDVCYSLANDIKKRTAWINRLANRCGFHFVDIPQEGAMDHIRWRKKGYGDAWTNAFLYAGEIKITDKNAFVQAMKSGVGKYKAYGCGMMMVSER